MLNKLTLLALLIYEQILFKQIVRKVSNLPGTDK